MIDIRIEFANFFWNLIKNFSQKLCSSMEYINFKYLTVFIMYGTVSERNSKIARILIILEQLKLIEKNEHFMSCRFLALLLWIRLVFLANGIDIITA